MFSNQIILGHKILHRIVGEEFLEFPVQLRRQRLIMRQHQRRLVQSLNHIRHRKRLAGTCNAQKRLKLVSLPESLHQRLNGLGLIAGRLVLRYQFEMIHRLCSPFHFHSRQLLNCQTH